LLFLPLLWARDVSATEGRNTKLGPGSAEAANGEKGLRGREENKQKTERNTTPEGELEHKKESSGAAA
jgi:hypothetical protein